MQWYDSDGATEGAARARTAFRPLTLTCRWIACTALAEVLVCRHRAAGQCWATLLRGVRVPAKSMLHIQNATRAGTYSPGMGSKSDVAGAAASPPEGRGGSTGRGGAAGPCAGRTPKTGRGKAPLCAGERDVSLALDMCNSCPIDLQHHQSCMSHESRQHSAHSPAGSVWGDLRWRPTQKTLLGEAAKVVASRWQSSEPAAAEERHWASAGPDRPA